MRYRASFILHSRSYSDVSFTINIILLFEEEFARIFYGEEHSAIF